MKCWTHGKDFFDTYQPWITFLYSLKKKRKEIIICIKTCFHCCFCGIINLSSLSESSSCAGKLLHCSVFCTLGLGSAFLCHIHILYTEYRELSLAAAVATLTLALEFLIFSVLFFYDRRIYFTFQAFYLIRIFPSVSLLLLFLQVY